MTHFSDALRDHQARKIDATPVRPFRVEAKWAVRARYLRGVGILLVGIVTLAIGFARCGDAVEHTDGMYAGRGR